MNYWLVKQEPEAYSWTQLMADKSTSWTGVRNFQARNHLRAMRRGDKVLFYHSVTEKQVVGVACVSRAGYPDPTAKEGDWSAVDLEPLEPLRSPVSLEQLKRDPGLKELPLLKQSRLSVMPITDAQFRRILRLAES